MKNSDSDNRPTGQLSPSAQRARIARLARDAPVLGRTKKGNYGAFAVALVACIALAGLTFFKQLADRFEDEEQTRSDLVELEMASPEDLRPRTPLSEEIAAQIAAEQAAEAAEREAALQALAEIELNSEEPSEAAMAPPPNRRAPAFAQSRSAIDADLQMEAVPLEVNLDISREIRLPDEASSESR